MKVRLLAPVESTGHRRLGYVIGSVLLIVLSGCSPGLPQLGAISGDDVGVTFVEGGVKFSIYDPEARSVHLVGDFNNWSTLADPLYDREKNGLWSIVIQLPPGRYEYKFLINGEKWIPDPGGAAHVDDGFGGLNSVLIVE